MIKYLLFLAYLCGCLLSCNNRKEGATIGKPDVSLEKHRPVFHFSPAKGWMNDPNGMVYLEGEYHLFFQHNPDSTVWGPMHWGHAISEDLVNWEEQEIALFPDTLGTIFSGSAVVDNENTAGFGKNALVAIFTHHNQKLEQEKNSRHQYQSLAYSNDKGRNWIKYEGNPVLPNPGISDFRDPKVMWHDETEQWIMTLATQQTITFYGSPDLKQWLRLSEFGKDIGAHGGVWECPDLISFNKDGKVIWALLVSINPGGPNGGSATQYFLGDFDGQTFTPMDKEIRWIDFGKDNYAGVTFSNTGKRKIFMGWMSNWEYANQVPTESWRSANTFPRELDLKNIDGKWHITSLPVKELTKIIGSPQSLTRLSITDSLTLADKWGKLPSAYRLDFSASADSDFSLSLSNPLYEKVLIGFDAAKNEFFLDRAQAGNVAFSDQFPSRQTAPRISNDTNISFSLLVDAASVEFFADGGLTVMTGVFFPNEVFDQITLFTDQERQIYDLTISPIDPEKKQLSDG